MMFCVRFHIFGRFFISLPYSPHMVLSAKQFAERVRHFAPFVRDQLALEDWPRGKNDNNSQMEMRKGSENLAFIQSNNSQNIA